MKFSCDKQQLIDALGLVVRTVSNRTSLSILECVLLTAEEGVGISLCASDLDISIETKAISAEVSLGGSIALDAKLFSEVVRKLPGDYISVETDINLSTLCKSGRSRLKIQGRPADEFPRIDMTEIHGGEVNHGYNLKAIVLRDMIRQTIFSISPDQSKLILTGELLEIKDNALRIVAVDMFRISYRSEILEGDVPNKKVVVPGKALNELSRILPQKDEDEVVFTFTPKWAIFETDEFLMVSKLLEGEFVKYDQIFAEDFTTAVTINRNELIDAFERAILVAIENRIPPTMIEISNSDLKINVINERGEVDDGIPCEMDGKELVIYFNPRYFLEALKAIEDKNVVLKFNTQLSPCTIRGADSEVDCKYLIVPLRPPS